jgi:molybdopterin-guanine dinucleotide biosynthesis protein A
VDVRGAGQLSAARPIVAVLAGGRGTRIGGAKSTRALAGRSLISYPLSSARAAGLEAVVVAKPDTALPAIQERVIVEPDGPRHPLCGALAALEHAQRRSPGSGVVVVGADMPLVTPALLRALARLDRAVLLEVDGRRQPLPVRLLPTHARSLRGALEAESSLRAAFAALDPRVLVEDELRAFGDPRRLCFSVNTPADLRRAERWLAEAEAEAEGAAAFEIEDAREVEIDRD